MSKFILCICVTSLLLFPGGTTPSYQQARKIVYLPLGDSYTICTGASENESWPLLMAEHLSDAKRMCRLVNNPARNGFTTQDLIDYELPLCKKLKPDLVTILIGVNDWVRGVPEERFEKNLVCILSEVEKNLAPGGLIFLLTIPDFGVTPGGKRYASGRDISSGIEAFNRIIRAQAKERGINVVELFELSKKMGEDNSLVAADGLHPSAREYAIWESVIFPVVAKRLQ